MQPSTMVGEADSKLPGDLLFNLLLVAVVLVNLAVAPYTKVEESFNLQATHDILVYGTPLSNINQKLSSYDHFSFPGAVPRTFIGPLFLATFSQPIVALLGFEYAQLVARGLLGLFNASALIFLKSQLHTACGPAASRWYAAFQASQFHVIFYASRTLPNMFAFGLSEYRPPLIMYQSYVSRDVNYVNSNFRLRTPPALQHTSKSQWQDQVGYHALRLLCRCVSVRNSSPAWN